ncbi:MAG: hypothetical protein LUF27_01185 [Lachnospiraceae bacterium]|nr:hypothetical protein [Lachnospiraceae bacterium]
MEGKKYVVQAILIDGDHERVINSTHTDDYEYALDVFMRLHRSSHSYIYNVMDLATKQVTKYGYKNIYQE